MDKTVEQIVQQCIKELCEIAEPEAAQRWFSRWIRSTTAEVELTNKEALLREELSKIGPNEPHLSAVQRNREQYAAHAAMTAAMEQHGDVRWVDAPEHSKTVCKATLYLLSMKGPHEGAV